MRSFQLRCVIPLACLLLSSNALGEKLSQKLKKPSMNPTISLSTTFDKKSAQHGVLSYRVSNHSQQDIYLLTPLTDNRGGHILAMPPRVYVQMVDAKLVQLSKQVWPIPDMLDVYMPEMPFLTKLPAGQSFTEDLQLPLPLISNFPYRFYADAGKNIQRRAVNVVAQSLVFSIAYVGQDVMQAAGALTPEPGQSYFSLSYGDAVAKQQVLTSNKIAVDVPVTDMQ